ncbi:TPM domain-containing protein [Aquabacterium fontiphilum]|jgi:uncharacterized membrane protein|uniref:TPM domain-containing protein n=1 Tax=Aquabacterium fontiphilum TaxID=450365 RepID=UPI00137854A0|nr:TPM domain-containing protein [Aquabacterium fontiphilum]NBD20286.1 TPM domain-containing protein [Aquabacterium fontiphilum]
MSLTRWIRHLWLDAADTRRQLTDDGLSRLEQAVRNSEARHLGELRVCIEAGLDAADLWRGVDARQRALTLFSQLGVWDTEHNNGVLIYLLLADRRIEVLADRGLSRQVPEAQWRALVDELSTSIRHDSIEAGLQKAIARVCELLRQHHPAMAHNRRPNELPDSVVLL